MNKKINVTYLIGNGFDINLGLNTSYKNFLETNYANSKKSIAERINDNKGNLEYLCYQNLLKLSIRNKYEKWCDFEKALGKFTSTINFKDHSINMKNSNPDYFPFGDYLTEFDISTKGSGLSNFVKMINYIVTDLDEFLTKVQDNFNPCNYNLKKFKEDLENFDNKVSNKHIKELYRNKEKVLSIVQFNYTNALDRLIELSSVRVQSNLHVHGKLDSTLVFGKTIINHENKGVHGKLDSTLVFGVAEASQLSRSSFRKYDIFTSQFVKPLRIKEREEYKDSIKCIESADVIVAFGMSFGETDKNWCELIANKLRANTNTHLVIFGYENETSRDNFIKNANISKHENCYNRIFIEVIHKDNDKSSDFLKISI